MRRKKDYKEEKNTERRDAQAVFLKMRLDRFLTILKLAQKICKKKKKKKLKVKISSTIKQEEIVEDN